MHGLLRTLIAGNRVAMQTCALYKHRCAVIQSHHLCPESWFKHAGKPVSTPLVELCPTCHMNIHAAIDGLLDGHDISAIPVRAQRLAREAFRIAEHIGLTPTRTL
jgi:hypothetical protein